MPSSVTFSSQCFNSLCVCIQNWRMYNYLQISHTLLDGAIGDRLFNVGHGALIHLEAPPVVTRLKTEKKLEQMKKNKKDLRRR